MSMSELKQKLLIYELEKIGFRDAQYHPVSDRVHVQPDNDRMPKISNSGGINYGTEYDNLAVNTLRPLVDRVNEVAAAWENSGKMPFEELKQFRILAEYNGIMLAARDDTVYGRGLHFVTWQYNYDRTGLDHGHYTEDYNTCKEDFAVRSGLVPKVKLFTQEQAVEIKASIEYRLNNDEDITISTENELNSIDARLRAAYPDKDADDEKSQEATIYEDTQNETIKTAKTIYGDVQPGDWVIAAGNNDYGYLLGTVTAIDKHGTPEHETGNETDDIHVDFTAFDYPLERIDEIEKDFGELFNEEKEFDELPLDDVIMAPGELIRITHLGHDEISRMGNLRQNCESFCNCFISPSLHHGAKFDELVKRVDENLADYYKTLDGFGHGELIDMAGRIDAINEAHHYMTLCYAFSAEELDFYLQFENPLEIVADGLIERRDYSADLDYAMENLNEHRDMLITDYPLIKKSDAPVGDKSPEAENPSEKQGISEYEDNGQRIIPATDLPEGWEWRLYDDGSGGLYSPDNKSIVEVDFATSEYRRDGEWHFINGYPYETVSSDEFMASMEKFIHSSLEREPVKPKTLAEKMQAATEKAKAQDTQNKDKKSKTREERN